MKIIKRDGRIVEYNRQKISVAIEKANTEVHGKEKADTKDIEGIIEYIEDLGKKRMLVEDIQDIIEKKLMEIGKYELAKKYIVYRYTRTLVRKQNATDQSILGLIRNENRKTSEENNENAMLASTQRDNIAGEVSRDLTNRLLLPEKIVKAHKEGILYFHNSDYFVQPIVNSSFINLGDMLDNGTVINGYLMESPKSFQVASIITTQIIAAVASNQYGEQIVDISHLGKYLNKSYEKYKSYLEKNFKEKLSDNIIEDVVNIRIKDEVKSGVQTMLYQIATLVTASGQLPSITLFLNQNEEDNKYRKENEIIINEIKKQREIGIKNSSGEYVIPKIPKLIYKLDNQNEGTFNQGVVSINLQQIGNICNKNEKEFWKMLDERLELCREALMCRHYSLLGTKSDVSPIHWQYGALARLGKHENIDSLLFANNSTLTLGYAGLKELTEIMKGEDLLETEVQKFANKVIKYLQDTVKRWKKESNIGFELRETTSEKLKKQFNII